MPRERDTSKEAFWRGALRSRARSGLSIVEFCENEGLAATTYHYWQRQIKRRDADSGLSPTNRGSKPCFAPVQLVEDRSLMAPVEIVTGNGYVIRISEQATSEQVRRVLQAVNELR